MKQHRNLYRIEKFIVFLCIFTFPLHGSLPTICAITLHCGIIFFVRATTFFSMI